MEQHHSLHREGVDLNVEHAQMSGLVCRALESGHLNESNSIVFSSHGETLRSQGACALGRRLIRLKCHKIFAVRWSLDFITHSNAPLDIHVPVLVRCTGKKSTLYEEMGGISERAMGQIQ